MIRIYLLNCNESKTRNSELETRNSTRSLSFFWKNIENEKYLIFVKFDVIQLACFNKNAIRNADSASRLMVEWENQQKFKFKFNLYFIICKHSEKNIYSESNDDEEKNGWNFQISKNEKRTIATWSLIKTLYINLSNGNVLLLKLNIPNDEIQFRIHSLARYLICTVYTEC